MNEVLEVVVLVLLEGSEDEVENCLSIPTCSLAHVLLTLFLLSLVRGKRREGERGGRREGRERREEGGERRLYVHEHLQVLSLTRRPLRCVRRLTYSLC